MPALRVATSHPRVASLGASRGSPMVVAHHLQRNTPHSLEHCFFCAKLHPGALNQKVKAQQLGQGSRGERAKINAWSDTDAQRELTAGQAQLVRHVTLPLDT